jgi:hypothetical protein
VVERYHLGLAAAALLAGVAVAAADRWAPAVAGRHGVGLAGLAGAVLGGWGNPRWLPWLAAAAVVAAVPDGERPAHPLGRWVVPLTVAGLVGVWSAVPDTEAPLVAGAALAPLGALRAAGGRTVGPAGTAALVAAVAGAAWVGSAGWGSALAAGVVGLGMVAVAPAVAGVGAGPLAGRPLVAVVAAHLAVVLTVPRLVIGGPLPAAVGVAAGAGAVLAAVAYVAGGRPAAVAGPAR